MNNQYILVSKETAETANILFTDMHTYADCWVKTIGCVVMHNSERKDIAEHNRCSTILMQPSLHYLKMLIKHRHRIDVQAYATASGYAYAIEKSFIFGDCSGGTSIADSFTNGHNIAGRWDDENVALEAGLCHAMKIIIDRLYK